MKISGRYEKPDDVKGGPQWECSPGVCKLMTVLIPDLSSLMSSFVILDLWKIKKLPNKLADNIFLLDNLRIGTGCSQDPVSDPVEKHKIMIKSVWETCQKV